MVINLLFEHNPGLNIAKAKLIKTCNIKYIFSFPRYILQSNRWCYHGLLSESCLFLITALMTICKACLEKSSKGSNKIYQLFAGIP